MTDNTERSEADEIIAQADSGVYASAYDPFTARVAPPPTDA